MSVEHLIVAHEATEAIHNRSSNDGGFGKYPCVKEKLIKEVASEILRLWMYSLGNLFYARDDKTLAEGLDMFFVEEKKRAGELNCPLCDQLFLNENACSADESSAKTLFKHPSTTFVSTQTYISLHKSLNSSLLPLVAKS